VSPTRSEIDRLHAQLCSGISDPTRIAILYALDENPRTVTQLVEELQLPQSTVSRHLAVLRATGLVTFQRQGRRVCYLLKDHRVIQALDILRGILDDHVSNQADLFSAFRSE